MSGIFISFIHSFAFLFADFKNMILAIFLFLLFWYYFLLISAIRIIGLLKISISWLQTEFFWSFLIFCKFFSLSLQIFFSQLLYFSFWNPTIWILLLLILLTKNIYFSSFKTSPIWESYSIWSSCSLSFSSVVFTLFIQLPGLISTSCFERDTKN